MEEKTPTDVHVEGQYLPPKAGHAMRKLKLIIYATAFAQSHLLHEVRMEARGPERTTSYSSVDGQKSH